MKSKGSFRRTKIQEINIEHIYNKHHPQGKVAKTPGNQKTLFPEAWSKEDIEKCIRRVWLDAKTKKIETQESPVEGKITRYRGFDSDSGLTIEIWYVTTTKIITTAYPVLNTLRH